MLNNVLFIFSSIYSLIMAHNYSETCLIHHVLPYFLYICFILSMMLISKLIFPDNSDLEFRK